MNAEHLQQLERLALLKQQKAISEREFQKQKAVIDAQVKLEEQQERKAALAAKIAARTPFQRRMGKIAPLLLGAVVLLWVITMAFSDDKTPAPETTTAAPISREDRIKGFFSAWDGAHPILVKAVKSTMNDADSFEHVKTTYFDMGKTIRIKMIFTGKNAFNATIKSSAWGDLDPNDGSLLKWGIDE